MNRIVKNCLCIGVGLAILGLPLSNVHYVSAQSSQISSQMTSEEKNALIKELLSVLANLQAQLKALNTNNKDTQHFLYNKNNISINFKYKGKEKLEGDFSRSNTNIVRNTNALNLFKRLSYEEMMKQNFNRYDDLPISLNIGDSADYDYFSTQENKYIDFIKSKYGNPPTPQLGDLETYSVFYIGKYHVLEYKKRDSHGSVGGSFIATNVDYVDSKSFVKIGVSWGPILSFGGGQPSKGPVFYTSREEALSSLNTILSSLNYSLK